MKTGWEVSLFHGGGRRGLHVFLRKVTWRASAADDDVGHSLNGLVQRNHVANLNGSSPAAVWFVERNADVGQVLHEFSELRLRRQTPSATHALMHRCEAEIV